MPSVTPKAPLTHLPAPPNTVVTVAVPAGSPAGPRTVPAVPAGSRPLIIAGISVNIDVTKHSPMNVVDLINGSSIPGVTAALDRYGQLIINGVAQVGGDASLLQHLGLA